MTDGAQLAAFFRELAENRKLHNDYVRDPVTTMRDYGLDEDTIALVMSGDLRRINDLLRDQDVIAGTTIIG